MSDRTPRTPSARVRALVLTLAAALLIGGLASAALRHAHLDNAEVAFLSEAYGTFPEADVTVGTLECTESLTAGLFKDETVLCQADATHRDQQGRFIGYMSPDFEVIEVAFRADS